MARVGGMPFGVRGAGLRSARYHPLGDREGGPGTRVGRPGASAAFPVGVVGQLVAQVAPLRLKDAGAEVSPVCVAWKPRVVEAPGAREAL